MTKAFRISLATATLFTFGLAVATTPAGAHEDHHVGCCGLPTLPPLTIPPFPTIPPLAGAVGVVGGSGTVQGGGGTGGFSSGFSLASSSPSSGPLSVLGTQLGGGAAGGFSLPSGGARIGGGSN